MKTSLWTLVAALAALFPLAAAETPAASLVPADAAWHIQADFERLKETQLGQRVITELDQSRLARVFDGLKVALNFDPRQDLAHAAAFGWEFGENAVVIVARGKFDAARLQDLVAANQGYSFERHGEHVIHGWRDAGKVARGQPDARTHAAVHGKDVVVVAPRAALVRNTLDVLDKPALSRAGRPAAKSAAPAAGGPFIRLSASSLQLPQLPKPLQAILSEVKSAEAGLNEAQGMVKLTVRFNAASEELARTYRDVLQGAKGVLSLLKDRPQLQQWGAGIETSQAATQATATLQLKVEDVVTLLRQSVLRRQGARPER